MKKCAAITFLLSAFLLSACTPKDQVFQEKEPGEQDENTIVVDMRKAVEVPN